MNLSKVDFLTISKRSVTTLLFAVLLLISTTLGVSASVGTSGTFGGTNYVIQPGTSLLDTGTDFNFVNNYNTAITVEFLYEAPPGVSINVPADPVVIASGGQYGFEVSIVSTAETQVGTYSIQIVGRVIPDFVNGITVTGSAGLTAVLSVQGISPTTSPTLTLDSVTSSGFSVEFTNPDPDPVVMLYSIGINPPSNVFESRNLNPNESVVIDFVDDSLGNPLQPNTTYTVFAIATASPRPESIVSSLTVTTEALPPADPDPEEPEPEEPVVTPPPTVISPVPPSSGGGGSIPTINVLVIDLVSKTLNINVFEDYEAPPMTAYLSVRNNIRETSRVDLTNRVVITGDVNTDVIGRYEVRYFLRNNTLTVEEILVVNVRDLIAPVISSPAEVTYKVDEPYDYRIFATDNYDARDDLIITGLPTNMDTTEVGTQLFNIVVADQSGNRTPFLLTVNVRPRDVTPIIVEVNDIELELEAVEDLFDPENYIIEVAVAANQPLRNSPSWTRYTGQAVTADEGELVYVRLTDNQGNELFGVLDISTGEVLPTIPDEVVIESDAWWEVLLRRVNILFWLIPFLLVVAGWIWFFFFIVKRRKEDEEEEELLTTKEPATSKRKPLVIPIIADKKPGTVVEADKEKAKAKAKDATPVVEAKPTKPKPKAVTPPVVEPSADQAEVPKATKPKRVVAAILPTVDEQPTKESKTRGDKSNDKPATATTDSSNKKAKPSRRRKPKTETYVQIVALDETGVMDDDYLGVEIIELDKKVIKDLNDKETEPPTIPATSVNRNQMDIFSLDESDEPTTKKLTSAKNKRR
jgi:hypothetical protein